MEAKDLLSLNWTLFWGVGGTLAVQLLLFIRAVNRTGDLPWRSPDEGSLLVWIVNVVGYALLSAFITYLAYSMHQVDTQLAAFLTGIGSDRFIEYSLKLVQNKYKTNQNQESNAQQS